MEVLVLLFVVGAVILVPVLILGALLKLAVGVILLPFKIIGVLFKGLFGVLGGILGALGALVGLVFGGLGLLLGLLVMVGVCVILPLAPLLLLGLIVWLALKAASPAPRAA
jgi:hypothetical protein